MLAPAPISRPSTTDGAVTTLESQRQASPSKAPAVGPASVVTTSRPKGSGTSVEVVVTPPRATSWMTGWYPNARYARACPSSWTSAETKTTTTQSTIIVIRASGSAARSDQRKPRNRPPRKWTGWTMTGMEPSRKRSTAIP